MNRKSRLRLKNHFEAIWNFYSRIKSRRSSGVTSCLVEIFCHAENTVDLRVPIQWMQDSNDVMMTSQGQTSVLELSQTDKILRQLHELKNYLMHNRISTIIQARQEIQSDNNLIGYDLRLNVDNFLVLKSVANWDMHSRYQKDKTEKLYKISGRLNSNTKVQKCTFSLLVGSNNYSRQNLFKI